MIDSLPPSLTDVSVLIGAKEGASLGKGSLVPVIYNGSGESRLMPVTESPLLFALLCLNSLVGLVLVLGAYDLKGLVLGWTGWIAGAFGGGVLGWVVLPELAAGSLTTGGRVGFAAVLVLIGAVFGRALLPFVARFAVAIAAFVVSTLATLVFTVGESVLELVYDPAGPDESVIEAVQVEPIVESGLFSQPEFQQFFLVSVVVGVVAGVLAMRYADLVISAALTGLGAGVLATTYPVWRALVAGDGIALAQQAELSTVLFLVLLLGGAAFQYARHGRNGGPLA